ncbi:MAG: DUF1326 domain-containing protein [Nitrososphaeraceae archaeon]
MKRQQARRKSNWKMHTYYLDACNCDWGCPCQFNAKPTHGNCEGLSGIHIIDGNYYGDDDVTLDGLIWPWVKYSQEFFTGLKTLELNNTSLIVGADNNLKAIMNLIVVLIRKLPFWKFKGEIKY